MTEARPLALFPVVLQRLNQTRREGWVKDKQLKGW